MSKKEKFVWGCILPDPLPGLHAGPTRGPDGPFEPGKNGYFY